MPVTEVDVPFDRTRAAWLALLWVPALLGLIVAPPVLALFAVATDWAADIDPGRTREAFAYLGSGIGLCLLSTLAVWIAAAKIAPSVIGPVWRAVSVVLLVFWLLVFGSLISYTADVANRVTLPA
jgi:hypothetical protein